MAEPVTNVGAQGLVCEAFGVCVQVTAPGAEELERVKALLPPGWRPGSPLAVELRLALVGEGPAGYGVIRDGLPLTQGLELDLALTLLEAQVRAYVALHSPEAIFVHAGVVAHRGQTIVVPGKSFAGKSTLVAALVRAGAVYYSDEFALLDEDGLVHPYAKPLSLRDDTLFQRDHHVSSFGGVAGDEPLPIGVVVVTTYQPGAEWRPQQRSPGAGALALMAHTVPAQDRPEKSMRAITRAVQGAIVLEGERGDADVLAPDLLAASTR